MSVWKQSSKTNKLLLGVLLLVFVVAFLLLILGLTGNLPFGGAQSANLLLSVPTPLPDEPYLVAQANLHVRSGPGVEYPSYGVLVEGASAAVIGTSPDGMWWVIRLPIVDSGQGWVANENVETINVENVPILEPPPTLEILTAPTPQPGTPSLTATTIVNIRRGPGEDFESYGYLDRDQTAQVIGVSSDGAWWVINLPSGEDGQGWVSDGYVITENTGDVPVIEYTADFVPEGTQSPGEASLTANLNADIHSGPGLDSYVFGVLGKDESAPVIGVSPDGLWWLISVEDMESEEGWVSDELVTTENIDGVPVIQTDLEPTPETTPSADTATVTAIANVNVRSGPDTGYGKTGLLETGQVAIVIGVSQDRAWWLIRLPTQEGGQGWVSAQYVTAKNTESVPVVSAEGDAVTGPVTIPLPAVGDPAVTAITNVNVRSGPGTNFAVISLLGTGQKAGVVGKSPDSSWWAISIPSAENGRGWISADYVTPENTDEIPVIQ